MSEDEHLLGQEPVSEFILSSGKSRRITWQNKPYLTRVMIPDKTVK